MSTEDEEYEETCKKIQAVNKPLLQLFEEDLRDKLLSKKTIKNHLSNADFYINDFLLHFEPRPMEEGCNTLEEFFNFFIHKCLWSTPSSVRSMGASLKKFYKCMYEHGKISKEAYEDFIDDIKSGMPYWVEECDDWNNGIF